MSCRVLHSRVVLATVGFTAPQTRKAPGSPRPLLCSRDTAYFRLVEMNSNLVLRVVPMPLTATMITTEIPAAIRPYSMAVAPDSSFTKRATRFFIRSHSMSRTADATLETDECGAVNSLAQIGKEP